MALRLIQLQIPADQTADIRAALSELTVRGQTRETLEDGRLVVQLVLEADETGHTVDVLDARFGREPGYQLVILPVLAALPHPEHAPEDDGGPPSSPTHKPVTAGLSREELFDDLMDMTKLSRVYVATVVLSVAVAAVGMIRDNVAVIIGAMVIAPLLGPNVAMAFASTLGDVRIMRRSMLATLVGVSIALAMTIAIGAILPIDPTVPEMARRMEVGLSDVVLALASGAAGALAMTRGLSSALVGVMVAVALLPPTVAVGLMLGAGELKLAGDAAMLLATNIICVNLAGVLTFRVQGVRPRSWWDAPRARRSARLAIAIWCGLLALLVALMILAPAQT